MVAYGDDMKSCVCTWLKKKTNFISINFYINYLNAENNFCFILYKDNKNTY